MKYILILMLSRGAAPVTPEHYMLTTAEFDDREACELVIKQIKSAATSKVVAHCFPKGSKPAEPKVEPKAEGKHD